MIKSSNSSKVYIAPKFAGKPYTNELGNLFNVELEFKSFSHILHNWDIVNTLHKLFPKAQNPFVVRMIKEIEMILYRQK